MKFNFRILLFLLIGLTSCIPYKVIDIQYLNKPELTIPSDFIKPLIVVNYSKNKSKTKRERFEYALDSVAAERAGLSLKESLQNSPWFEDIDIPIRNYIRSDSSRYIKPLSWNALASFYSKDSADLVISLDYMKVLTKSDSYRTSNNGIEYYYGYLKMPIYCYWRVYNFPKKQIPNGFLYQDTLIWDASDWLPINIGDQLPGYFKASAYAGEESGAKYAEKISPIWSDDKRIYFHSGSREMENAAIFVENGKWIDAASEWQKVFANKNKKLCSKAAFNLALANEMLGKFDISIEWLRKAKKFYPLIEIEEYRSTLESRINSLVK